MTVLVLHSHHHQMLVLHYHHRTLDAMLHSQHHRTLVLGSKCYQMLVLHSHHHQTLVLGSKCYRMVVVYSTHYPTSTAYLWGKTHSLAQLHVRWHIPKVGGGGLQSKYFVISHLSFLQMLEVVAKLLVDCH